MALYEHIFIARQDVSSAQVTSMIEAFSGLIQEGGGTVAKTEYWGLRTMAYRIKKNRKGHYVLLNLDAPSDAVAEMERQERLHEDVLRTLTLRVDEFEEGPSVVMQGRRERDSGRRDRPPRTDGPPRRDAAPQPVAGASDDAKKPTEAATAAPATEEKS